MIARLFLVAAAASACDHDECAVVLLQVHADAHEKAANDFAMEYGQEQDAGMPRPDMNTSMPAVDGFLDDAASENDGFVEEAKAIQEQVASKQSESKQILYAVKEQFDQQLEQMHIENQEINERNVKMSRELDWLNASVLALKEEGQSIKSGNHFLRNALKALGVEVKKGVDFVNSSLASTNDENAKVLKVLEEPKQEPSLEDFLTEATSTPEKPSLLAVIRPSTQPAPLSVEAQEEFGSVLSHRLADVESATQASREKLQKEFDQKKSDLSSQKESFLAEEVRLNEVHEQLKTDKTNFMAAKKHLEETRENLEERIQGLIALAKNVESFATKTLSSSTLLVEEPEKVEKTENKTNATASK